MEKRNFAQLLLALLSSGYHDVVASDLNRTLPVRLTVALAKPVGWLLPVRNNASALFFFFPFCHVGGAERVHADIVGCFHRERPWVFFTKRSLNGKFRHLFSAARSFNLWFFCKFCYPVSVGIMAGFVNRHRKPVVFGANSLFYYLLVPYLKPGVRCLDLSHAFGAGVEEFSLYAAARLEARVVINRRTMEDLRQQYAANGVDPFLCERLVLIGNATYVPDKCPVKRTTGPLTVLYVGRGSVEKRVHLIGKAARICREKGVSAHFVLVGDVLDAVAPVDREFCTFAGEITDSGELERLYRRAHVILIASSREGFPLTVMEGMANGVVPVCTSVGGIPEQVRYGESGLLVADAGENEVAHALADAVVQLDRERGMLARLSRGAHARAQENFGRDSFCAAYRRLVFPRSASNGE